VAARPWKQGEVEQQDFLRASRAKDAKTRIELLGEFLTRYPHSDYRDIAMMLRMGSEGEEGDWDALASDSRKLLRSPTVNNAVLLVGGY
jgi:hypothetical protein